MLPVGKDILLRTPPPIRAGSGTGAGHRHRRMGDGEKSQMAALAQLRGLARQAPPPQRAGEPVPVVLPTPAPAPPSGDRPAEAPARTKGGRPPIDTEQISLRPPKAWMVALRRMAAEASLAEGRTVTPQMIILRLLEPAITRELERRADG
jgi:hypothetical protein